jgi:cell division protein FtsB
MRISFSKVVVACVLLGGTTYGITILRGSYNADGLEKRRQIEKLERENEILQREIEAKKNHIDRLQKNPEELKLEIEEKYKLVPPGSKSFILQDGTQTDTPPSTKPRP